MGDCGFMRDYINNLTNNFDFYLYTYDFYEYLTAQEKVDQTYQDEKLWETKIFYSICRMGFFSSDRSIQNYAENIWKIKSIELPHPENALTKRVISSSNLINN